MIQMHTTANTIYTRIHLNIYPIYEFLIKSAVIRQTIKSSPSSNMHFT